MVEKIFASPEIYKIYVPIPDNPLKWLNSYVVMTGDKPVVIDTGFNRVECKNALLEGLAELGVAPDDCVLFITHLHADHCGLAPMFDDAGAKILMSQIDRDILAAQWDERTGKWTNFIKTFDNFGFPEEELLKQKRENQAIRFAPSRMFRTQTVEDGECFVIGDTEFICVWTPGHAPGHMCLYLPEQKILFSGDHILYTITPNIACWSNNNHSLADYMESLNKVAAMEIKRAFPSHREEGDFQLRLRSLKQHYEGRLAELESVIKDYEGSNAYELAQHLTWSSRGKPWSEFPVTQKWFAVSETAAHMDYLAGQGRAIWVDVDGNLRAFSK